MLLFENIKSFFKRPSTKTTVDSEVEPKEETKQEVVSTSKTKSENKETTKTFKSKKANASSKEEVKEEKVNNETKEENPKSSEDQQQSETNSFLPNNLEFKDEHDKKTIKERILSVDRFKGFCMFMLALSIIVPLFGNR